MSSTILHEDLEDATYTRPDGVVVRNLSAEEYAASYADGTPCHQIEWDEVYDDD